MTLLGVEPTCPQAQWVQPAGGRRLEMCRIAELGDELWPLSRWEVQ